MTKPRVRFTGTKWSAYFVSDTDGSGWGGAFDHWQDAITAALRMCKEIQRAPKEQV